MNKKVINLSSDFSELLEKLGGDAKHACLLDGKGWQRKMAWNACDTYIMSNENLLAGSLDKFVKKHQSRQRLIVGVISYDAVYSTYGIKKTKKEIINVPDVTFFAYDNYLEEVDNKIYARFEDNSFVNEAVALDKVDLPEPDKEEPELDFTPVWARQFYKKAFAKIKKYIYEGEIYQINLTQPLADKYSGSSRKLFANLSAKNSSEMKAYFEGGNFEIISMSPERFIRANKGLIETTPIKGTRPRGKNKAEDNENIASLLSDEKEKAELDMITDLLRNDIGKVCQPGSVEVASERQIQILPSVIHTFSLIKGRLKPTTTPLEALISMFPGGSVTGCPKKRAVEIINELEPAARGAYCGNLVVIDGYGALDSSILIRAIIKQKHRLSLSVGSGIVNDSVEQNEYQENLDKAKFSLTKN